MKVLFDSEALKGAVGRVSKIVEKDSDLEAHRNVKMATVENGVLFSSMIPGLCVQEFIPVEVESHGVLNLPGARLQAIVSAIPGKNCTISSVDGKTVTISSGRSRFSVQAHAEAGLEMPWPQPSVPFYEFNTQELSRAFSRCKHATTRSDTERPESASIHIDQDCMVATDRISLAIAANTFIRLPTPITIPMDRFIRIDRLIRESKEATALYSTEGNSSELYLSIGNIRLYVMGMAISYPNYKITKSWEYLTTFRVGKSLLRDEVQRFVAGGGEGKESSLVMVLSKNGINLSATYGISSVETFVDCGIAIEGEIRLLLGVGYLLSAVSSFQSDEISFSVINDIKPIRLSEPGYDCYIVPRRFQ